MKFFKIKYNYFLLSIFAILFLMAPVANTSAAKFGCVVNGECQEIEQPDESMARAACTQYCNVLNSTGFLGDQTCTFTPSCETSSAVPGNQTESGCVPGRNGQEVCKLTNPIGSGQQGTTEVSQIIGTVIRVLLGIIGGLTLLMFVYGGFRWLTSAGNPEKVKSGTQTMVWAVIGVMLVLASYLLLSTFLDFLTGKAT